MAWSWRKALGVEERGITITQNASREELMAFFGVDGVRLPAVNMQSALKVPAVLAAVTFLSRTLGALELCAFRDTKDGPQEVGGRLQVLVEEAPNPEWSSYAARVFFWQNVFLHGRGLFAILRNNGQPYEIWPMNTPQVMITMDGLGRKTYTVTSVVGEPLPGKTFGSEDVIDVPFMLHSNMVTAVGPITLGEKAIQLALAMNDYGSGFFAGGGVPPLALEGPLPSGPDAMKRAMDQVARAIKAAKDDDKPIFPLPPDHKLTPIGFDPAKGQMTEARQFQVEEIARVFQLPPVFLQDLSKATFSNAEQQDLHLVKHLVAQWATALEQEMNLKLFGQMTNRRFVRHNLDSLLRGDLLSRMSAYGQAINNAVRTPNEVRALENLPPLANGDDLMIQGATVPLGTDQEGTGTPPPADGGNADDGA
jgi:HK97 family phage portal protein